MTDEQQQSPAAETQAPGEPQPEASSEATPEAIEAYWRKRQSSEARAHSEEIRVLREQLATAQGALNARADSASAGSEATAAFQQQIRELQSQLRQSEAQRLVDTRRAMYPSAADALADNALIASMDEARLAALNAKLNDFTEGVAAPSRVDPNNPSRGATAPPKRLQDMSSDELKQVLAESAPAWLAEVRGEG